LRLDEGDTYRLVPGVRLGDDDGGGGDGRVAFESQLDFACGDVVAAGA